jgi:glucuronokinase
MNRNFDLRRSVFGDEALGEHNIELIEIARGLGLAAKLPGSSGAALILLSDAEAEGELSEAYAAKGYRYRAIQAM